MTGYESKRAAAHDKLDDDDALTIAYQSGYYDGKKAAQPAQEPVAWMYQCTVDNSEPVLLRKKQNWAESGTGLWVETPLSTTPPQRTEQCNYPDCKCPTENPCLKGLAQPAQEPVATLFGTLPVYDNTPPQLAQEREALKLALEVLENLPGFRADIDNAITAIKEVLEKTHEN